MAKFPEPPPAEVLAAIGPDIRALPAGTAIGRIYRSGGPHPATWDGFRRWGPTGSRFDHHLPDATGAPRAQERGILYGAPRLTPAANALAICAAEVFQDGRVIDTRRGDPAFVVFATRRELRLLDLTGFWPLRAGASQALAAGRRDRARRWSVACHAAFPTIDGLLYRASMGGGEPAVALYERAADALPAAPLVHRLLADPLLRARVARAAAVTGYALV